MKQVLIIEDNELNREGLSRRLTRLGFRVILAAGGLEGFALAKAAQPDLILLDLGMPEVDGWECAQMLKAEPATSGIPIVALTAHAMIGEREKALAAGCDEFDTKPIDSARLLATIDRLFHDMKRQAS